jgi:PhnB protein
MEQTKIPAGYQAVMPYLIVPEASRFSEFMQTVFEAKETMRVLRDEKQIMHGELNISGSVIMFAEGTTQWEVQNAGMFIYVNNADETYKKAIENGGTSVMDLSDQSYGRSGGVKDPFGNVWWITTAV